MSSRYSINPSSDFSILKADKALRISTQILFLTAVIGQWMFVLHIVSFYGGNAITGNYEKWNQQLYNGIIEGDLIGNLALIIHLFFAAVITFGGPLQFIAPIRKKFPRFHRLNGRLYIFTAFLVSVAGLYMIFTREVIGGKMMMIGNSLNALLIMLFAILTFQTAVSRNFTSHRRWALRTFLVVNGVWFFRIGFGIWIALTGGTMPGSTENLGGPFDLFLIFAHTLLPLAILEFYFYTKKYSLAIGKYALAIAMLALTFTLGAGIFMTAMAFWIPS